MHVVCMCERVCLCVMLLTSIACKPVVVLRRDMSVRMVLVPSPYMCMLAWLDVCRTPPSPSSVHTQPHADARNRVLDPIDGTKGFLRGGQYAVGLALIEDGKPVLGACVGHAVLDYRPSLSPLVSSRLPPPIPPSPLPSCTHLVGCSQ
jgi:hypothetical protein